MKKFILGLILLVGLSQISGASVIKQISDQYGFDAECTPIGELRVVNPTKLVGTAFIGPTSDANFWYVTTANGGTNGQGDGQATLRTNTTANGVCTMESTVYGRYVGGSSPRFRAVVESGDSGTANNIKRWGVFDYSDGAYFELNGSNLYVVTRKGSVESRVPSSSWNKSTTTPTVEEANTYEIYWTNKSVWFVINDKLKHQHTAPNGTWANTVSFPVRIENSNIGGSTTDTSLYCRTGTIYRLGPLTTQPINKFQSGTIASYVCKYGAGNLHGGMVSNVTNNAVITIYDSTSASGTILWSSGAMGAQTIPFPLDFHDIPFSKGLTFAITGANCNLFLAYE